MSHAGGDADNRLDEPMLSALERGADDDATGGSGAEVAPPASSIGASLFSSTINLANTCMGTGVLALPAAFAVSGLLSGVIVCVSMWTRHWPLVGGSVSLCSWRRPAAGTGSRVSTRSVVSGMSARSLCSTSGHTKG